METNGAGAAGEAKRRNLYQASRHSHGPQFPIAALPAPGTARERLPAGGAGRAAKVRAMDYTVRRARTGDVRAIRRLVDANVASGRLLGKPTVTLYEDIQEFLVAEPAGGMITGCGALHVMWEDLAEIRTLAVDESSRGHGIGRRLVEALVAAARQLDVQRVFVLTFEVDFF